MKMQEISCDNKKDGEFVEGDNGSKINTPSIKGKRFHTGKTVGETRLFHDLNIAYKWMSVVGLLYLRNPTETVNQQKSMKQKIYIAYQYFIDILIAIDALRYFAIYPIKQEEKSFLLAFDYHSFIVAIAVLSCMQPYLEKHINQFIVKIYKHKMNNCDQSSINRLAKFIRFYVFSICTVGLLVSIVFNWVTPTFKSNNIVSQSYPFTKSSHFFYPALLIFGLAQIIGIVRVYGMLAHCFAISHFLTLEYIHLAQKIRSRITEIKDDDGQFLEAHRARFETLNDLVNHVNRFSNIPLMIVVFYCLFELCLMIYGMLESMQAIDVYAMCIWSGLGMLFTVSLIVTGIFLSSSAHQLADDLYAIDHSDLSPEASLKVSIFLYRLTGPPIGISVAGLFVIDHSTIMMLTGTLLTYIIVVIQTKTPDCGSQNQNSNNITMPGI